MIQIVPSLVNRAKTMLPLAYVKWALVIPTMNRMWSEPFIDNAVDIFVTLFCQKWCQRLADGRVLNLLQTGAAVADLGCGAGILMLTRAKAYSNSTFHGFEISKPALEITAKNIAKANVKNVVLHDANESSETYDLVTTFDILHDCTHPKGLIAEVKAALHVVEPELLSDGPASSRESCKNAYGRNILCILHLFVHELCSIS
jgi:SAM-dependent methyltransferase